MLVDDNDGLAARAAAILARAGYGDLSYLEGGVAAWENAGFVTFSGVHVPSKAFGEFVEHDSGTPSVCAKELDALMRNGTKLVVLDSRPFDEYSRISIPTGINVPGAELVLRARDIAPSPDTTIVVNCAGRTRSIIGAQSLINAGVAQQSVALRNGTMGWHLAGLACATGKADRAPQVSQQGARLGEASGRKASHRNSASRVSTAPPSNNGARTQPARPMCSTCAIRPNTTPAISPAPSRRPAANWCRRPTFMPARCGARIVVSDDKEVRALMTASWLKQMGWQDVFVLPEAGNETGEPPARVLGAPAVDRAVTPSAALEIDDVAVIDLSTSPHYRRGHIPGAWFAIRARLDRALPKIAPTGDVILTSEDGVLASLAVAEAQALTEAPGALAQGRQRRLGRRRLPARDRREDGGRGRSTSGSSPMSGRATTRRR